MFIGIFLLTLLGNLYVILPNKKLTYNSVVKIPQNKVGLLLGTSNKLRSGRTNYFFKTRIEAAAKLFDSGKVNHLILSGDNSLTSYNEPRVMFKALLKLGIPQNCMTLDFAGFRTLDSVVRSKKVFQQQKITIISQKFHNYRALFIAKRYGIDAIAFNTDAVREHSTKTYIREYFARLKAILDLHILKTKPKFLGEKIYIEF